jgi:hypothetical protein
LINHYKGIPLIHEGFITSLTNDTITIHSQKIQTKAILDEKSTTFETDKVTIHAKLKEYNEVNDELIFENLEKIEHSPRRRKVLRIKPDKEFTASIFHNSDRYNFEVTSISSKAISFEIKEFDGKIKLDEKVSLTIGFDTFYTTSYHNAVAHKERIDIKATVFKIKTLENNLTKIVMIFDLNLSDKKVLEKYIYQREVELIKEFKKITHDT